MDPDGPVPACSATDCDGTASFYRYAPEPGEWQPVCAVDARTAHPSLEVHAWLESGYLRPVELGEPAGRPDDPPAGRGMAFRQIVERAMGWDG